MTEDPIRRLPSLVLVLIVPVVAVIAIGLTEILSSDDTSSSAAPAGGAAISIENFTFKPQTLTAAPGARVVVANNDQTAHTATATDEQFDTGDIAGGATATITAPTKPGTYSYFCDIHQYMKANLEVQG